MTPHETKITLKELSHAIAQARAKGEDASDLIAWHHSLRQRQANGHPPPRDVTPPPPRLEVLTSLADLQDAEYEELLQDAGTISPFMTLDWLEPWHAAFGSNHDLHLAVVRQGERLLAVLPFMIGLERYHGVRRPVTRFIGTGPGLRGNYFTIPLRPDATDQALDLIRDRIEYLHTTTTLLLENLSPFADGTPTLNLLCYHPRRSLSITADGACIHGPLPDTFDEFIASVPAATRRTSLRHGDAVLRQHGDVEYRVCRTPGQIPEFLDWLARFSIERRAREGQQSTWGLPENSEVRGQICARLLARDRLRLELLIYNRQPIAALIGFVYNNIYFCYNTALNQAFSDFQPGHILLAWRIRECISEGLSGFNFLVGDAEYKRQYFRQALPELTATVLPPRGIQHCFEGAYQFLRGLRRL